MSTSPTVKSFLDQDSETFSYVVSDPATKKAIVVDSVLDFDYKSGRTATISADEILAYVTAEQLDVEWILETHAHADHLSAAPYLRDKLGAKIGIGAEIKVVQAVFKDLFNLEKEFLPNGSHFDKLFADGDTFSVGNLHIRVMHTPGHTPADLAYIVNEEMAYVGDTIFAPDVGTARCDFPGGSAETLFDSVQKLLALPDETKIYLCHDYPTEGRSHTAVTTVKEQRTSNKHVKDGISKADFVAMRTERDATLSMPRLILPAIQVNIRAGEMPPPEANGQRYLKIPIDQL